MGECLIMRSGGAQAYSKPVLNSSYPTDVTLTASASASATFSISMLVDGDPAEYTYQWYKNGLAVSGATSSTYTISGLTSAATYTIYCAVTNKAGTVNSRIAKLTVASSIPQFSYSGQYSLIDDGDYNWRLKLLSSGTISFTNLGTGNGVIDVFCVGGGGGGGANGGGGGGGGYTTTSTGKSISANTDYLIVVGAGGGNWSGAGGESSAFGVVAAGGNGSGPYAGGAGGSGGGGAGWETADSNGNNPNKAPGVGGSDGSNGGAGNYGAGTGQGATTREFGENGSTLYAGGGGGGPTYGTYGEYAAGGDGGGGAGNGTSGTANTGGGGGGRGGSGGSGIVIIRNHR